MDYPVQISVVMPTYNTDISMLKEAVDSILNQTFKDFEFIIIDDGSANGTWDYLNALTDQRVKLIRNETNLGISKSLNIGLRAASGKYIARMDADDIALPSRFEKQYAYMENHPDVLVCGTDWAPLGKSEKHKRKMIRDPEKYNIRLLFNCPGPAHPTVMMNRRLLDEYQVFYREDLKYAEDYMLFSDTVPHGKVSCVEEVLLYYRYHDKQVSCAKQKEQMHYAILVQQKLLKELLGTATYEEACNHYRWACDMKKKGFKDSLKCFKWYSRLIKENLNKKIYNRNKLAQYVSRLYLQLILPSTIISFAYTCSIKLSRLMRNKER